MFSKVILSLKTYAASQFIEIKGVDSFLLSLFAVKRNFRINLFSLSIRTPLGIKSKKIDSGISSQSIFALSILNLSNEKAAESGFMTLSC